jgi:hypothetical protein
MIMMGLAVAVAVWVWVGECVRSEREAMPKRVRQFDVLLVPHQHTHTSTHA